MDDKSLDLEDPEHVVIDFNENVTLQVLLDDLKLINSLKPDTTIDVTTKKIVEHNYWYSSLSRRIRGENKWQTVQFVSQTVLESENFVNVEDVREELYKIPDSLQHLLVLYKDYSDVTVSLNTTKRLSQKIMEKRNNTLPIQTTFGMYPGTMMGLMARVNLEPKKNTD